MATSYSELLQIVQNEAGPYIVTFGYDNINTTGVQIG
jgi:hypothetical protein